MKRCLPVIIAGIDVRASAKQQRYRIAAMCGRLIKRGAPILVLGIDIRTFVKQPQCIFILSQQSSDMKRSLTIMIPGIDIRTLGKQQVHKICVS